MKIVHLTTSDISGGAARAATRLSSAMCSSNIESHVYSFNGDFAKEGLFEKIYSRILSKIYLKINDRVKPKILKNKGLFSYDNIGIDVSNLSKIVDADVVYLHWINNGFLSLKSIEKLLKTGKIIIIYMHDMWFCTGGCHHSFDCVSYTQSCFNCSFFVLSKRKSSASQQLIRKQLLFSKYTNLRVVAPSLWLTSCASNSAVFKNMKVFHIPNVLNLSLYKKVDRYFARNILGLPLNSKIVCFGADSGTHNPYKGWSYLQDALTSLSHSSLDMEVLVFGSSYNKSIDDSLNFKVNFTGILNDDYSLVLVYNAIDVFVTPSIADNFPNVIVEAMACGVPVVGFNTGGIPDLIDSCENGYLANYLDSSDLADGIKYILTSSDYDRLSNNARDKIETICNYNRILSQHKELWK